jgi:hypothetical protein
VVFQTEKVWWNWNKRKRKLGQRALTYEGGWLIPDSVEMGPWQEFQKVADGDEMLAVVWSKILKYSDEQISQGLGVTVGTVRHRTARGIRLLNSLGGWGGVHD